MNEDAIPSVSSMDALRQLQRFMAPRKFVSSRRELTEAGFDASRIKNWLRHGRLVLLLRGVYSFGRDVGSRESAWRAALLAAGPGSVLNGRSACELWGMITPTGEIPRYIEVAVTAGEARRLRGTSPALSRTWINIVKRQFSPEDISRVNGLEVTSALVALVDFAAKASPREVRFAFLEGCRLGLVQKRDVIRLRRLMRGRRGVEKLNPLVALWDEIPG